MTNKQVDLYLKTGAPSYQLDPLSLALDGTSTLMAWLEKQDFAQAPLIYATAHSAHVKAAQKRLGVEKAGEIIETALAACAVSARNAGARRFIVAGGETSGAVTQALGIETLTVGPEICPGVPWTFCESDGSRLALTLKSGNFGTEAFFSDASNVLDAI